MLIKINTSHLNCDVLPRASNPDWNKRVKLDCDLALNLLGSSAVEEDNGLGFPFFEVWDKTMEMKNSV